MVGIPLSVGFATSILCAHLLRAQIAQTRWWLLAPAAASVAACVAVERLTRRLLPLAALLKLAMLFPETAPSRFKVARGANSVRSIRERLAASPARSASAAAEAALALITALTVHDRRTRGHSERVRIFTDLLGEQLHLPHEAADRLRWAALLHDIGKLEIAVDVLNKPAKLDPQEWKQVSAHPVTGERILGPLLDWLGEWGAAVRQHHEKYDGTGYPDGATGSEISRAGRIVAITDAYEVMTAHRAYKKAMSTVSARAELASCAGTHFDPGYVRAFLAIPLPRLLWAMGPGSLLMNVPLLRFVADSGTKGVLASSQSGVAALSAAAVLGGLGATGPVAATPPSVQAASTHHRVAHHTARTTAHRSTGSQSPTIVPTKPNSSAPTKTSTDKPGPTRTGTPTSRPTGTPGPTASSTAPGAPSPSPTATPPTSGTPSPSPSPSSPTPDPTSPTPDPTNPTPDPTSPVIGPPDVPGNAAATAGDTQVTVTWSPPADTGGAALTQYTVTPMGPTGAGTPVVVAPGDRSVTVTGLANGSSYHFTVVAANSVGSSPSADTNTVVPAGPPEPPTGVTAVPGDTQVGLSWTASDGNGSPVSHYAITPRAGASSMTPTVVDGSATQAVITGLADGTSYVFDIVATNGIGRSTTVTTASVSPVGAPEAPSEVFAAAGDTSATVSWSGAADNGSAITGYRIVPVGPNGSLAPTTTVAGARTAVVSGLTNGTSYRFEVRAVNSIGTSAATMSAAVVPAGSPLQPVGVTASAGDGQATIFWTADDDNGSPILDYTVTPVGPGGPLPATTVGGGAVSTTITGLTNGTTYTFEVTATNALGTSAAGVSLPASPMATPPAATAPATPGSPTAATALAGATVSWTAPSDGGSPITSYTITAVSGGVPAGTWQTSPLSTSYVVTGLIPGIPYSFTISANNAVGSSAPATTPTMTPVAVPDAVSSVVAVAGDSAATVSWSSPADGGSPLTGYTLTTVGPGGPLAPVDLGPTTTSTTVTGLVNGATYRFEITAGNAYGTSVVSMSNSVTPLFGLTPDARYIVQGGTEAIDVLSNDIGDLDPTTVTVMTAPSHGTAMANSDGTVTYHADKNYHGSDAFTYEVCDTAGFCGAATVTMTVLQPGQQNTDFAGQDLHGADLHGVDFSGADLTGANLVGANLTNVNFHNATLDGAVLSGAIVTGVQFNQVSAVGTDFSGLDLSGLNFSGSNLKEADLSNADLSHANLNNVVVDDQTVLTGTNLTGITGGPPPHVAGGASVTTILAPVTINLLALTTDPDAPLDPTSIVITKAPAHGRLVVHANGTVTYTPNLLFIGTDSFNFKISNVLTMSGPGTVKINVIG
jgi:titin